jgi:hypothetical protein
VKSANPTYGCGHLADLTQVWEPYEAARTALGNAVTLRQAESHVRGMERRMTTTLSDELKHFLSDGVLSEEFVLNNMDALLVGLSVTPGCQNHYMDHAGSHKLVFCLQYD